MTQKGYRQRRACALAGIDRVCIGDRQRGRRMLTCGHASRICRRNNGGSATLA